MAVGDRVTERRPQVGVKAAERNDVRDAAVSGGPDDVLMVKDDLRRLTVAGDEHECVDAPQCSSKPDRV